LSVASVARGGLFILIGAIISAVLGFAYWLLMSSYGGSEVVGIATTVFNLSVLVSGAANLGVPVGVQRFLGREFSRGNNTRLNTYFWSSLTFCLALTILPSIVIWIIAVLNVQFIGFSNAMIILTGFLVLPCFTGIFTALFTSTLTTKYQAISDISTGLIKVVAGVFFVYIGLGWLGAVMGIMVAMFAAILLMLFFALRELGHLGGVRARLSLSALGESVHAGLASWPPSTIALIGQQLSFLWVFGLQGGVEAGMYYMAFAIFNVFYMLPTSFTSILFPVLSGLKTGENAVAWKVLRICLALACPLVAFLTLYSNLPLSLIPGSVYTSAAPTLSILCLSIIPLTFILAVNSLVYASGSYKKVLALGLATNIPRVILYFPLVPVYGGFGAALSFVLGTFTGLVVAIYLSKTARIPVSWSKTAIAIVAPFAVAIPCFFLGLSWYICGAAILLFSVLCYGRSRVVERSDLREIAQAFASEEKVARAGERLHRILRVIYGD
jgi:O-antigen/teichoic acid export membrane protein